jgi:foldase protein PrsA
MKKIAKRLMYLGLLTSISVFAVACSKPGKKANNGTSTNQSTNEKETDEKGTETDNKLFGKEVVSVGNKKILYSEAMAYFKSFQTQMEAQYGSEIWGYDFGGGQTFEELAKQDIMNMMVQNKIISEKADKFNVSISEDEEAEIKEYTTKFLAGITEEDKAAYGITEEIVTNILKDDLLKQKVYEAATLDVDTDVSDEEAKQITIQHLLVKTQKTDESGKTVDFTEEEKAEARKKAEKLLKEAKETDDFNKLAEANTDDSSVEYTFGKGEMVKPFEEAAFAMKPGEVSDIVETDYGFHILYCVSDFNEDATQEQKEEIISNRQSDAFQKLYEEWNKDTDVKVNNEIWDSLTFISEDANSDKASDAATDEKAGDTTEKNSEDKTGEAAEDTADKTPEDKK